MACRTFPTRMPLHEHVAQLVAGGPIAYLEFGVWQGETFRRWLTLNGDPGSRFVGFNSFEGLPEDWEGGRSKGTFSTGGKAPTIDDPRGRFVVGWFQDTLYDFLKSFDVSCQLVVHVDCDLYSSTLFVLCALDRHMPPGTLVIFDDFHSLLHEFAAWLDYRRSFNRTWEPVALVAKGSQAAYRLSA